MDACLLLLALLPSWESLTSEKHCFLPPLMIDDIQSAVSRGRRDGRARKKTIGFGHRLIIAGSPLARSVGMMWL